MTIWLEDGLKNQDQSVETASGKLVTPSESYLDNSTSNVLIPLDSWTSGLLVYRLLLSEAWDILAKIFNDNKRSRSIVLKAELRSLKLGDLNIDAYFRKIESIATILASLGSPITTDIVNIAFDGLLGKYEHVSDIIIYWELFSDLKTVRSILTTAKMRLKSRAQTTSTDSSPFLMPFSLVSIRCTNALDIQEMKCYVVFFLVIQFRVIKRNLPFFVMLGKHVRLPFVSYST
ncbi:hypothetical protein Tco_0536811 [Tanacetum coccineum]